MKFTIVQADNVPSLYIANALAKLGHDIILVADSDHMMKHMLVEDMGIEYHKEFNEVANDADYTIHCFPEMSSVTILKKGVIGSVTLQMGELYGPGITYGQIYHMCLNALYGKPIMVFKGEEHYCFVHNLLHAVDRAIVGFEGAVDKTIFINDGHVVDNIGIAHAINIVCNRNPQDPGDYTSARSTVIPRQRPLRSVYRGQKQDGKKIVTAEEREPYSPPVDIVENQKLISYEPKYQMLEGLKFTMNWIVLEEVGIDEATKEKFKKMISAVRL